MTTMLDDAYDKLFLFVEQLCLLPEPGTRFGRDHQQVWSTLGAAEKAFTNVDWELGRATQTLCDAAMGAMQEGDTVELFLKRWHDFQRPLASEASTAGRNADSLTFEQVAAELKGEASSVGSGLVQIQYVASVLADRQNQCRELRDVLYEVDRNMTNQQNEHPDMDKEYDEMYNKIVDDKNYAFDVLSAIQVLSGCALEVDNPLSTRDRAVDYLVEALKKEKARDQHGNVLVPNRIEKIFKHINEKLGKTVA